MAIILGLKIIFMVYSKVFQDELITESLIPKPVLEFVPMQNSKNTTNTLIWIQLHRNENWQLWADKIEEFLMPYQDDQQAGEHGTVCSWDRPTAKERDQVCYFDIRRLKNCRPEQYFGYKQGSPCILLKMNKILDWVPVPYNNSNIPEDMPKNLKQLVVHWRPEEPMVWISCEGENPADKENIGPVTYYPNQGFPTYYFPFTNSTNYLSPFVFVQFLRPTSGVLINIECRAWAHNIEYNPMDRHMSHISAKRLGAVHFELMID